MSRMLADETASSELEKKLSKLIRDTEEEMAIMTYEQPKSENMLSHTYTAFDDWLSQDVISEYVDGKGSVKWMIFLV